MERASGQRIDCKAGVSERAHVLEQVSSDDVKSIKLSHIYTATIEDLDKEIDASTCCGCSSLTKLSRIRCPLSSQSKRQYYRHRSLAIT